MDKEQDGKKQADPAESVRNALTALNAEEILDDPDELEPKKRSERVSPTGRRVDARARTDEEDTDGPTREARGPARRGRPGA
jgi:hypothetical protein